MSLFSSINILNLGVKIRKIHENFVTLCQDLTKVESRHDSAN